MKYPVYADTFRPSLKISATLYDVILIVGFSFLIGFSAQFVLPLPFSPVPITAQTLVVLLVGSLLGKYRGALCVLLYLIEGSLGMPFFAGGKAGLAHLVGPTGGYLLGFSAAVYVVGTLAERGWDRKLYLAFAAMLLGNVIIYFFGLPWWGRFVGFDKVYSLGFYPFVIGDLLKIGVAAFLLPGGWKVVNTLTMKQKKANGANDCQP